MKVNGETIILLEKTSLLEFLQRNDYAPEKIAVELNGEIIPRSRYAFVILTDADKLEIVSFVGGG
ncbi:MAG: sulfur carrier protein ThiS [Phascolarctobacterium sp.]|nr:sulfur carrier protein ThiS [Phascolarctobacterium sp.]